jgi:hypothetical protein
LANGKFPTRGEPKLINTTEGTAIDSLLFGEGRNKSKVVNVASAPPKQGILFYHGTENNLIFVFSLTERMSSDNHLKIRKFSSQLIYDCDSLVNDGLLCFIETSMDRTTNTKRIREKLVLDVSQPILKRGCSAENHING